ncbi:MAG: ribosome recycling factor [Actinobacteria bacterium]|nr:ribosome recycling factor [Actinomycetota bacterium]MCL6104713.1 ribosome recycling factor [Actinomycetota bacterium]
MVAVVAHLKTEFAAIRTSRASTALFEGIMVEYYGNSVPLRTLASLSIPEASMLVVTPYDKDAVKAIEKAILASNLGVTPNVNGNVIRVVFAPLTEERRKEFVKLVKHKAEESKVGIRNLRRGVRHNLETLKKDGEISSDELERTEKELDKITHEQVMTVDALLHHKEQELLEV